MSIQWKPLLSLAFKTYLILTLLTSLIIPLSMLGETGNIAVIRIHGVISTDNLEGPSAEELSRAIQRAAENEQIKAIILHIQSPGGSATGSMHIASAVRHARESKPVIAYIYEEGLSGAYWIASQADMIITAPGSLVGSIGVRMSTISLAGLLKRLGITYENLSVGEHKDMLTPFRNLTAEERAFLLEQLRMLHTAFWEDVKRSRNLTLTPEEEELITSSLFFTPEQALRLGLIDEIGFEDHISRVLEETYTITDEGWVDYTPAQPFFSFWRAFPQSLARVKVIT